MDAELKGYLDAFRRDVAQQIAAANQKMDMLNTETRQELTVRMEQLNVETRRELRVLLEDMRHEVRLVVDGVITVRDQLGRILTDHEARLTALEQRQSS
ncbi:MAG: hypothetical protein ACP5QO_05805 [Clostridia bacterium]